MSKSRKSSFERWLVKSGAQSLAVTNPYELARFKAGGQTHVVYKNNRGQIKYSSDDCKEIHEKYLNGQHVNLSGRNKKYCKDQKLITSLTERDGDRCFYCDVQFSRDLKPTLEHLVSRSHDGPDHESNYVLACGPCNKKAGNLPVVEKVQLRERLRASKLEVSQC